MSLTNYHRPAILGPDPARLRIEPPPCSETPAIHLVGVAADVTPASLRRRRPIDYRTLVRVGSQTLNLTHEHEPGWPPAMRLQPGYQYQVQAFECESKAKTFESLPLDAREVDEHKAVTRLTFYTFARAVKERRDDADMRRICRNYVAAWTDGLALTTSNTDPSSLLKVGAVYKIVVERQALAS